MNMNIWVVFLCLQILDVLTTILFILAGAEEGMWVTRWLMNWLGPWYGLMAGKLIIAVLLVAAFIKNKRRAIVIANYVYLGVIGWNVLAAIISLVRK